jgi:hypothetical protein
VLLALIGPQWLTITNKKRQRRLDDPGDYVRLEIETALTRKIRVIPILVDDAGMPGADELPAALAPLVRRNAVEINPITFDTKRLISTVQKTLAALKVSDTTTVSASPTSGADRANQQVEEPEVERLTGIPRTLPRRRSPRLADSQQRHPLLSRHSENEPFAIGRRPFWAPWSGAHVRW